MEDQHIDTEITLGVGKLLGLFFMLVILCGVFLGLGYMLGRNSVKQEGLLASDAVPAGTISSASKPGATQSTPAPKTTPEPVAQPPSDKADSGDAAVPKIDPSANPSSAPNDVKIPPETRALNNGGYVVQVAAVSKKEDADALQQALQHKQYPVVITPSPSDKLFHVQIGPFAELKDAESMKTRLASDGYNAIVKR